MPQPHNAVSPVRGVSLANPSIACPCRTYPLVPHGGDSLCFLTMGLNPGQSCLSRCPTAAPGLGNIVRFDDICTYLLGVNSPPLPTQVREHTCHVDNDGPSQSQARQLSAQLWQMSSLSLTWFGAEKKGEEGKKEKAREPVGLKKEKMVSRFKFHESTFGSDCPISPPI